MNLKYEYIITGRRSSFFAQDIEANSAELLNVIKGSRIAVVGAAGSIGSWVVKTLLRFEPEAISLVDISENNLVELVRDLRSSKNVKVPKDFKTMPIGLGSIEFDRYFAETERFDFFFNLSAVKHVRSEKDIYCLMRMLDTNVLSLNDFLEQMPYRFSKAFSVSSDKAANPANMMGASKMVMEQVLMKYSDQQPFSTARFANVAFSDGSLPHGFHERLNKMQPLSAPRDVKRYFISHQEAGELCVLSAALGSNRDVFFPKLSSGEDEKTFSQIAVDLLHEMGLEPVECSSEEEAKAKVEEFAPQGKWPCYFFNTDTTGEKGYEEFYTEAEDLDTERFQNVGVIMRDKFSGEDALEEFLDFARAAKTNPNITKTDYVKAMIKAVPTLKHSETGKNLDQKM
ncbi:UDP-N-acetyl-alpha-D-glucosamine C6 dehydratase [Sedimentisphaera cyanobacteriorum]|uniref:UDP-N-acetyl-alpha-D-glucosamine C6 dehydratase n=1 Tax=Sedimentisphaera cyanobacteriorum TaxID=1940790 RepID=A0A1Q2HPG8_9BACT|nr:polysaccharide biosynthesis protein [Sedimentisphaera cyanobacteriorum]AQQ09146.1 UDP-N-acetyl-alpha-D-glucosamine C6 dehydratase [Sedimentisphaera cyanobacteriorum]